MKSLTCLAIGAGIVFGVDIDDFKTVAQLKDMIQEKMAMNVKRSSDLTLYVAKKNGNWLTTTDAEVRRLRNGELPKRIYDNMSAENEMKPTRRVDDSTFNFPDELGGGDGDFHVLVVVPGQKITKPGKKAPPAARKRRWDVLNVVLHRNAKTKTTVDGMPSTGFSHVSYRDVQEVMRKVAYDPPTKAIGDSEIDFLHEFLAVMVTAFGGFLNDTAGARLHLIAPMLVCVCALFDGAATLRANESVEGQRVHADGTIDFVIQRGTKRLVLVEAKGDNANQGIGPAYVGSEALADVEGLSTVSNVATTFDKWYFSRITDMKVELDVAYLTSTDIQPPREDVKMIAEKMYAMLAEADV